MSLLICVFMYSKPQEGLESLRLRYMTTLSGRNQLSRNPPGCFFFPASLLLWAMFYSLISVNECLYQLRWRKNITHYCMSPVQPSNLAGCAVLCFINDHLFCCWIQTLPTGFNDLRKSSMEGGAIRPRDIFTIYDIRNEIEFGVHE